MKTERRSLRQALILVLTRHAGEEPWKSGEIIKEALGEVVPPLAGKTPKATAAAQLGYLVRDGLVVRKGKGLVALAPQGSGASPEKPEPKPTKGKPAASTPKTAPPKKSARRSRPPKADASG